MINSLRTDLKQNVCSLRFLISSAVLLGLFLMGTGVPDTDIYGVEPCTILKMLLTTNESVWMQSPCFSASEIWQNGLRVLNLGAFLPLIMSYPVLPLLTDELKTQNYRFHCVRSSYRVYALSKCFAEKPERYCFSSQNAKSTAFPLGSHTSVGEKRPHTASP